MTTLTLSVITPSWQQGRFIGRTIQSVLTQGIDGLEYVVIDGGSTDDTLSILKQHQHQLSWVSEADGGQGDAVNKGLQRTSGDIIGWLNSDDIYYPGTLKKILDYFARHPHVDIVYGDAHEIDAEDNVLCNYRTRPWNLKQLERECFISQPATFFRRRVVERYGVLDDSLNYCLDYEYWLRLGLHNATFAYLNDVLSGSRIHAETKSMRGYLDAHFEALNMLQKKLGYIPSNWIVNYSSAKVKTESHLNYPHPRFVLGVWLNLWKVAGFHHQGWNRIKVWLRAQQAMLGKIVGRLAAG